MSAATMARTAASAKAPKAIAPSRLSGVAGWGAPSRHRERRLRARSRIEYQLTLNAVNGDPGGVIAVYLLEPGFDLCRGKDAPFPFAAAQEAGYDRQPGVCQLVHTGQARHDLISLQQPCGQTEAVRAMDQTKRRSPGNTVHMENLCPLPPRDRLQHAEHLPVLSTCYNRHACLDNSPFFSGDLRECVAKVFCVIECDVRDDTNQGHNDIGSIEPPTQACFDDG